MLKGLSNVQDGEQKDVQSVGTIMMEIMEPETSLLHPGSIVLQYPDKWRDNIGIKSFLTATAVATLQELKEVNLNILLNLSQS